ncbi:uncharacterized protein LOC112689683 [Sipha flava]|jgi:hypothetical protein|uniref:Uncharacterized protein LOC112689683 n=1 Tax=Sipha flava TaxID=143950 RepID=A0A8B8G8V8_9HEMI|nr:uncharacterized protein LOC112689683 [Sipha flava]
MDRFPFPVEQRPSTAGRRSSVPRTMPAKWKVASNVRSLSVYLEPILYEKGVESISSMNEYYLKRDPVRFKMYLDMYEKFVMNDEVAKFRAKKKIEKLYGDLIVVEEV